MATTAAAGVAVALVLSACSTSSQGSSAGPSASKSSGSQTNDSPGGAAGSSSSSAPSTSTTTSKPGSKSTAPSTKPPPPTNPISIPQSGGKAINPKAPIVVSAKSGTLTAVNVTNAAGVRVTGDFTGANTKWASNEPLGYGKTYKIIATGSAHGTPAQQTGSVTVINPTNTTYPNFVPPPSQTSIGVGQPLVVRFDKNIPDKKAAEKTLKVTTSPPQPGAWYWISAQQVDYRAQSFWQPGTKIHLEVNDYGASLGGGMYGQEDRTVDRTVHDSWIAKADGATHSMEIYRNGVPVKSMPVSIGDKANPTHIGTHVIQAKYQNYTMNSCTFGLCPPDPGAYIAKERWTERISNDGEFVHENPKSVGAQGNTNVSHGCINLNEANAIWFYNHFGLGDVVEVSNSGGQALPLDDTYGDWAVPWSTWSQGNSS
ncbi:MAG: Ig-like domain-containing protein [Mycobacteriales bacterium]